MKNFKIPAFILIAFFIHFEAVYAAEKEPAVLENDYILSAGGVLDGKYIWTIPYETGSFSKIDVKTGKKENLSRISNFKELQELSGYASGAVHTNEEGEKFLYLVPFEFLKPLVRINLSNMKMEYPFRNIGYYYGSCHIVSKNGMDYLWLFPREVKPNGTESDTEIVVLNLTQGKKECSISTKIDDKYYAFSNTVRANDNIWLLPAVEGQPLVVLDTGISVAELDSEVVKKLYSGNDIRFSKISTATFDGNCLWLVCEDVSYALNNSCLIRCDQKGNFIEKYELSKERFVNAIVKDRYVYLFAGAYGKKPGVTRINMDTGKKISFQINGKNGYVPSTIFALAGEELDILVIPNTVDGRKLPLLRLISKPNITAASANAEERIYRDYGDFSKGIPIEVTFEYPSGFSPSKISWIVSGIPIEVNEKEGEFQTDNLAARRFEIKNEKMKSINELTILAEQNGYFKFMFECESQDKENMLYAYCDLYIDNIYERLPIKIARYNIDLWDDSSLIESVTHLKDYGAAFSFDGSSFIKTDAPMELIPAKEVLSDGKVWELASPITDIISFDRDIISPDSYFAELEFFYSTKMAETFDENDLSPKSPHEAQIDFKINNSGFGDNKDLNIFDNEYNQNIINETHNIASDFTSVDLSEENKFLLQSEYYAYDGAEFQNSEPPVHEISMQ